MSVPGPVMASVIAFARAGERGYPGEVLEGARLCLVDWTGVAIGAVDHAPGAALSRVLHDRAGRSVLLSGGSADAATAALINGTLAHSLDFDDTHVGSLTHISGPTWAAVLALAPEIQTGDLLGAFVTGFEIGARLGTGVGAALLERGLHPTGILGCIAATAAGCALLRLDEEQTRNALGLAATQAAGLTASFGTMAKPFHAGKAAMNAVLAVQLARSGFTGAVDILDGAGSLAGTLIQDRSRTFAPIENGAWHILRNTFKPYASCLLTHPSIDCAREICRSGKGGEIQRVAARVHPLAIELAGKRAPRTPLEGKFSLPFCIALALTGRKVSAADFNEACLRDAAIGALAGRVELTADPSLRETAAALTVDRAGASQSAQVAFALGNPENPMQWPDMEAKFLGLTEQRLGSDAGKLFAAIRAVEPSRPAEVLGRFCTRH